MGTANPNELIVDRNVRWILVRPNAGEAPETLDKRAGGVETSTIREILCEQGRRGQKAAAGYYDYDANRKATPSPVTVQLALVEIHERVDDTYFRPSFVGWEPTAATR